MVAIVLILIIFCLLFIFRKNTAFLNLAVLSSIVIDKYWNNELVSVVSNLLGNSLSKENLSFIISIIFLIVLGVITLIKSPKQNNIIMNIILVLCSGILIFVVIIPKISIILPLDNYSTKVVGFLSLYNKWIVTSIVSFSLISILFNSNSKNDKKA